MKLFTRIYQRHTFHDLPGREKSSGIKEGLENIPESPLEQLKRFENEKTLSEAIVALELKVVSLDTGFDVKKFSDSIKTLINQKILAVKEIPPSAKEAFLSDFCGLVTQLSSVVDIDKLKLEQKRYKSASLGTASNEESSLSGILENTLKSTFEKYVHGASAGLRAAFVEQKKVGNSFYNEKVYADFIETLGQVDDKYPGIDITGYIKGRIGKEYLGDRFLSRDIGVVILKKFEGNLSVETYHSLLGILTRNSLTEAVNLKRSGRKLGSPGYPLELAIHGNTNITIGGKIIDFLDLLLEYTTLGKTFVEKQSEIGVARERTIGGSVLSNLRKWIGLPILKSEFDFLEVVDTTSLTFGKIVQLATQVCSMIVPGIGGAQDLTSAITSIDNSNGTLLPGYERAIFALFGAMDISIAGSLIAKLRKVGQLSRLQKTLQRMNIQFPQIIQNHIKNGGKISKEVAQILINFGKAMGQEIGVKMHDILSDYMRKNGMILDAVAISRQEMRQFKSKYTGREILEFLRTKELKLGDKVTYISSSGTEKTVTFERWVDRDHEEFIFTESGKIMKKEVDAIISIELHTIKTGNAGFPLRTNIGAEEYRKLNNGDFCIIQDREGLSPEIVQFIAWRGEGRFSYMRSGRMYYDGDLERGRLISGPLNIRNSAITINVESNINEINRSLSMLRSERGQIGSRIFNGSHSPADTRILEQIDAKIRGLESKLTEFDHFRQDGINNYTEIPYDEAPQIIDSYIHGISPRSIGSHQNVPSNTNGARQSLTPNNSAASKPTNSVGRIQNGIRDRLDVRREARVVSIGDLHGNYQAFEDNLRFANLIDNRGDWIGGTSKVVFQGDILGDRVSGGPEILSKIDEFRRKGAKIDVLAGNHDDFLFAVLTDNPVTDIVDQKNIDALKRITRNSNITVGNSVYIPVGLYGHTYIDSLKAIENQFSGNGTLLERMKRDPKGQNILEQMCNMKLVSIIDDTLFLHVPPNNNILILLNDFSIDQINNAYQAGMKHELLGAGQGSSLFNSLRAGFLNTGIRKHSAREDLYRKIKEKYGINHIIHGHDSDNAGKISNHGGISITSSDHDYGKPGGINDGNGSRSVVQIHQDGRMTSGMNRELLTGSSVNTNSTPVTQASNNRIPPLTANNQTGRQSVRRPQSNSRRTVNNTIPIAGGLVASGLLGAAGALALDDEDNKQKSATRPTNNNPIPQEVSQTTPTTDPQIQENNIVGETGPIRTVSFHEEVKKTIGNQHGENSNGE